MKYHNFLLDEDELKKFHELILPELGQDECFFVMIGARRKYLTDEQKELYNLNGSDMLKRVTVRSNKYQVLKDAILELCCPEDRYRDKNGLNIPHNAFTLYITPNARDARRASVGVVQKMTEALLNPNTPLKLENMMLSEIHKYSTNKVWMDFDVDPKDRDNLDNILESLYDRLGASEYETVITRSGAHVLLKKSEIDPKVKATFYKSVQQLSNAMEGEIEIKGDTMLPVPGCSQGGRFPYIMEK